MNSCDCRVGIKNLSFSYGQKMLFENISLDMEDGFVSIIGPNGSGKTTLVKLITGLLPLPEDTVKICGRDLNRIPPNQRARLFTVINQKQVFPFPFTCLELISLGRYPYKRDLNDLSQEDYQIIIDAMRETEVLGFKDKMITDISGGEQQRVILAAALAQDTSVIYLDEAFSALDICHKANMIRLLKERVRKKGILVVAIMHDLNDAYRYSDKVCILDQGKIVGYDRPEAVMTAETISKVFKINVEQISGKGFFINL